MTKDEFFKLGTALVQEQVYAWVIASSFVCSWKPPRYGGRHAIKTELVYSGHVLFGGGGGGGKRNFRSRKMSFPLWIGIFPKRASRLWRRKNPQLYKAFYAILVANSRVYSNMQDLNWFICANVVIRIPKLLFFIIQIEFLFTLLSL